MARSERFIAPSEEELRRLQRAQERARQLEREGVELLRTALKRVRKSDLIELALRATQEERVTQWLLERELALDKPVDLLVHDVEVAISIATRVDELRQNYNFDYDWRAYDAARRGLEQLIEKRAIEEAKGLALKLMAKGSYQMEASDEGLMKDDIESCLRPVISAATTSTAADQWALKMLEHDRTGCLCERELSALASRRLGGE